MGGYAIWAIGLGLLSTLDENTSTAKIIGYQILNGCKCGGERFESEVPPPKADPGSFLQLGKVKLCKRALPVPESIALLSL